MALPLPKNPKVADLAAAIVVLDARVGDLEGYVQRNNTRITALEEARIHPLEEFAAEHSAGAERRNRELEVVRHTVDRDRWLRSLRGRRR